MDGDMNNIFQKLSSILEDKETAENLKNIFNNYSSSENESSSEKQKKSSDTASGIPDFDINTILKLKSIMDNMNNSKNDPRANLLLSLKPYISDTKKDKVDQYIKLLNMARVIEIFNPLGGDDNKNV